MLKIHISTIDELNELTAQLGVVTYLQDLILYDENCDMLGSDDLVFAREFAKAFIFETQYKTVTQLRSLVTGENFAVSDTDTTKA
ncbi:MAG: hypothetical protein IJO77_02200 [Oscillospiraceae bacterium]|nr:hypothetical protein [Oscillospiraceae bacterium]MBQ9857791.1 hypothetical protein [Oscillospiraceae bacterium]